MKILAIDTASEYLSLTLSDGDVCHSHHRQVGATQSQHILPAIANLCQQANWQLNEIKLIAYNQGPGSFTGLRIGLSVAMGLAYSLGCQLLPIPAFASYLKDAKLNSQYLAITLDARLKQIYLAIYDRNNLDYIVAPCLINPEQLATIIAAHPELTPATLQFTGKGYTTYQAQLPEQLTREYSYIDCEQPTATMLLDSGLDLGLQPCSPVAADLLYLRNKVALNLAEQLRSKQGGN